MKKIALKIDADTCIGTLHGVPVLMNLLQNHGAQATFFFSLGPDRSGRQSRDTSLKRFYGLKTRLHGCLLPSPMIGRHCRSVIQATQAAGFETGIHAWNRVAWEDRILTADNTWSRGEIDRAAKSFRELLDTQPVAFAAAGWRSNRHALRQTQRLGFSYASDCRGSAPFIPVIDGEIIICPQIPTSLPTLDETLSLEAGLSAEQAAERILQLSCTLPGDHVFTLRAELEGMKFAAAFAYLLAGWKSAGFSLIALREIRATLDLPTLPRHAICFGEIPGRAGKRMLQGGRFP